MLFDFTKELIGNFDDPEFGFLTNCRKLRVYQNFNLVGTFFYHNDICRFIFKETEARINIKNGFFKKSVHTITDTKFNTLLGSYIIKSWVGFQIDPDRLTLGTSDYECKWLTADTKYSLFKQSTWGHHKIEVANALETVTYRFRIPMPFISGLDSRLRPFHGTIESTNENLLLVLSGLFWVEHALNISDIG